MHRILFTNFDINTEKQEAELVAQVQLPSSDSSPQTTRKCPEPAQMAVPHFSLAKTRRKQKDCLGALYKS